MKNGYDYKMLKRDLSVLNKKYGQEFFSIGKSSLNKDIYCTKIGTGEKKVFYCGAHHGLESITSALLILFTDDILRLKNKSIYLKKLFSEKTLYIVYMVNPDGVDLAVNGLKKDNPNFENLLKWKGDKDFKVCWQANNNGVDLNHNYNALWCDYKKKEEEFLIKGPGPTRYSGAFPESEPETKALSDFTRKNDFSLVMAFHSQGEVIYQGFNNYLPKKSYEIGKVLCGSSGYTLEEATGISSYGGYKDWFIDCFKKPGFTIEIGKGTNPLPLSQLKKIYKDLFKAMLDGIYLA